MNSFIVKRTKNWNTYIKWLLGVDNTLSNSKDINHVELYKQVKIFTLAFYILVSTIILINLGSKSSIYHLVRFYYESVMLVVISVNIVLISILYNQLDWLFERYFKDPKLPPIAYSDIQGLQSINIKLILVSLTLMLFYLIFIQSGASFFLYNLIINILVRIFSLGIFITVFITIINLFIILIFFNTKSNALKYRHEKSQLL